VIEEKAVAGLYAVSLAVVHHDPVAIYLGHRVGATRIEGRGLLLRDLLHQAVELAGTGLVDTGSAGEAQHPQGLQDAQGTEGIAISGVFRGLEAHRHMTLGTEVANLIKVHLLDNPDQVGGIGEIAVDRLRGNPGRGDRCGRC